MPKPLSILQRQLRYWARLEGDYIVLHPCSRGIRVVERREKGSGEFEK